MCNAISHIRFAPDSGHTFAYGSASAADICSRLPIVAQLLLNDLRDTFVIFGNSGHDLFGFGVLHIVGKRAHFFRSKSPEFWILQIGRGHSSTVSVLVAAAHSIPALTKMMRL